MLFYWGLSWLIFDAFMAFGETAVEHGKCPVGFPGSLRRQNMQSSRFLCQDDSDCPNGKCCGILGENMCIYWQDDGNRKLDSKNIRSKLSQILRWPNVRETKRNTSEIDGEISTKMMSQKNRDKMKCSEGPGKRSARCSRGFRWKHLLFLLFAGGVCISIGYVSLMLYQKSKNASGFKKTEPKRKVISVAAVYRQDPVYTVGEDKRVILNVENHTGSQPTSTNDVTDPTIDKE